MELARRGVLVQLDDDLVERLVELAAQLGTNRSELLRQGAAAVIAAEEFAAADHDLIAAYQRQPPTRRSCSRRVGSPRGQRRRGSPQRHHPLTLGRAGARPEPRSQSAICPTVAQIADADAEAGGVERGVDDDLAAGAGGDELVDDVSEADGAVPAREVAAVRPPWALQRERHIPGIIENRSLLHDTSTCS